MKNPWNFYKESIIFGPGNILAELDFNEIEEQKYLALNSKNFDKGSAL